MAPHSLLHRAAPSVALVPTSNPRIRRIFNNDQIIEKFDNWLLLCGKSKNTRDSYRLAAKQLAKFIINKPLIDITKEDVRAFLGSLYSNGFAASTIQVRLETLRLLGDCLHLGGQVRVSVPRYIRTRKVPEGLPHAKSEKEIQRVTNSAAASSSSLKN
jgi:site-specific recombinase XerD